jgi:ABC-type proline/glycine betaine transport system ATPase subunit
LVRRDISCILTDRSTPKVFCPHFGRAAHRHSSVTARQGRSWRIFPREPDFDRGVVFQRYSVFPHLTALENVIIGREFELSGAFGRL